MAVKRSVEGLRESAQKKRQETFEKVERGIQQLIKEKRRINFNTVVEASGVSKAWLYKEPEVKSRIEQLRAQSTGTKKIPPRQQTSDKSKDALIKTLKDRIKRLVAENQELRQQNQVAYGQVIKAKELERKIERLESENAKLRGKTSEGESTTVDLSDLGVEMNSTLERLINETPEGIVATAIESLRAATITGNVQNPGGFLNRAIRDAWRPNEAHQQKSEMEEFNQWWKWAYPQGLVKAATQFDGIQHVMTPEGKWVPFDKAVEENPYV
jgi:DNA repair exonuclease SbcCD ATPase subunit